MVGRIVKSLCPWFYVPETELVSPKIQNMTVGRIETERSEKNRHWMIERYGVEQFIRDSDARQIFEDNTGSVWSKHFGDDEPAVMVELYPTEDNEALFLLVPPTMRSFHEGINWSWKAIGVEENPLSAVQRLVKLILKHKI